jgi:hypothetical protein
MLVLIQLGKLGLDFVETILKLARDAKPVRCKQSADARHFAGPSKLVRCR